MCDFILGNFEGDYATFYFIIIDLSKIGCILSLGRMVKVDYSGQRRVSIPGESLIFSAYLMDAMINAPMTFLTLNRLPKL